MPTPQSAQATLVWLGLSCTIAAHLCHGASATTSNLVCTDGASDNRPRIAVDNCTPVTNEGADAWGGGDRPAGYSRITAALTGLLREVDPGAPTVGCALGEPAEIVTCDDPDGSPTYYDEDEDLDAQWATMPESDAGKMLTSTAKDSSSMNPGDLEFISSSDCRSALAILKASGMVEFAGLTCKTITYQAGMIAYFPVCSFDLNLGLGEVWSRPQSYGESSNVDGEVIQRPNTTSETVYEYFCPDLIAQKARGRFDAASNGYAPPPGFSLFSSFAPRAQQASPFHQAMRAVPIHVGQDCTPEDDGVGTGGLFTVASGPCTATDKCVHSPNFPSKYGDSQSCSIRANVNGKLRVDAFSTERCCDRLTIGSIDYAGSSRPGGVSIDPTTSISWRSDGSGTESGWKICLGEPATIADRDELGRCQCGSALPDCPPTFTCEDGVCNSNTSLPPARLAQLQRQTGERFLVFAEPNFVTTDLCALQQLEELPSTCQLDCARPGGGNQEKQRHVLAFENPSLQCEAARRRFNDMFLGIIDSSTSRLLPDGLHPPPTMAPTNRPTSAPPTDSPTSASPTDSPTMDPTSAPTTAPGAVCSSSADCTRTSGDETPCRGGRCCRGAQVFSVGCASCDSAGFCTDATGSGAGPVGAGSQSQPGKTDDSASSSAQCDAACIAGVAAASLGVLLGLVSFYWKFKEKKRAKMRDNLMIERSNSMVLMNQQMAGNQTFVGDAPIDAPQAEAASEGAVSEASTDSD